MSIDKLADYEVAERVAREKRMRAAVLPPARMKAWSEIADAERVAREKWEAYQE